LPYIPSKKYSTFCSRFQTIIKCGQLILDFITQIPDIPHYTMSLQKNDEEHHVSPRGDCATDTNLSKMRDPSQYVLHDLQLISESSSFHAQ